jgi:hypothetical protein
MVENPNTNNMVNEHKIQYHYLHLYLTKERKKIMNRINKINKEGNTDLQSTKELIILLTFRMEWLRIQAENIYNTKLK